MQADQLRGEEAYLQQKPSGQTEGCPGQVSGEGTVEAMGEGGSAILGGM